MQATIHNEFLTLTVDTHGAEAVSLKNAAGQEMLWQADPAVWKRHAPILFPWTGKLTGGAFTHKGKIYPGGQHGFARDVEHTLLCAEGDTIRLELRSDEKSKAERFPFDFVLTSTFRLEGRTVHHTLTVTNPADAAEELQFGIGYLRAAGNALTASLISVLVCVLDAIFNFFLINPTRTLWGITVWGAGLGVPGAALGTALATVVGGLLALSILLLRKGPLCIRKPAPWKITRSCLRNLLWVGGPLAGERAAISLAQVVVVRIVAGLGTVAIAANSLAVNAEGLCYMAGYGIQSAAVTLIGQAVGANRKDMAKRFAWLCTGLGMGVMALSGVGLWIFAPTLMSLFTTDAAVIALGAQVLRIEAWAEPMFGASIVASGAMQGAGDSTSCFVLNIFSMWCIRLTLAFLLAPRLGLMGVWGAMCCELSIRGLLFLIRLARGKWLEKGALS